MATMTGRHGFRVGTVTVSVAVVLGVLLMGLALLRFSLACDLCESGHSGPCPAPDVREYDCVMTKKTSESCCGGGDECRWLNGAPDPVCSPAHRCTSAEQAYYPFSYSNCVNKEGPGCELNKTCIFCEAYKCNDVCQQERDPAQDKTVPGCACTREQT